jgi:hypothetical protein
VRRHLIILWMASTVLAGCARPAQTVHQPPPQIVQVPVAVPCPAPAPTVRPHLAVADLPTDADPATIMRAYAASLMALQGYARELEALLDTYRTQGVERGAASKEKKAQ